MTDEPSKISAVVQIARKTIRIANENIVFALGVKILVFDFGSYWIRKYVGSRFCRCWRIGHRYSKCDSSDAGKKFLPATR